MTTVYRVTLEARPDEAPAHVRLRRLLKVAGRGFAPRCVDVVKVEDGEPGEGGVAPDAPAGDTEGGSLTVPDTEADVLEATVALVLDLAAESPEPDGSVGEEAQDKIDRVRDLVGDADALVITDGTSGE